jgi:hypothetical protein
MNIKYFTFKHAAAPAIYLQVDSREPCFKRWSSPICGYRLYTICQDLITIQENNQKIDMELSYIKAQNPFARTTMCDTYCIVKGFYRGRWVVTLWYIYDVITCEAMILNTHGNVKDLLFALWLSGVTRTYISLIFAISVIKDSWQKFFAKLVNVFLEQYRSCI